MNYRQLFELIQRENAMDRAVVFEEDGNYIWLDFIWITERAELILIKLILQQLPDAFGNSVPEQLTDSYCKENGLTSLHYTLDDLGKES